MIKKRIVKKNLKKKKIYKKRNVSYVQKLWVFCGALIVMPIMFVVYLFCIKSDITKTTIFEIQKGETIYAIANRLKKENLLFNVDVFKVALYAFGNNVQAGVYELDSGESIYSLADKFSNGKIATVSIMIPEGLTVRQIRDLLEEDNRLSGSVKCASKRAEPVCNLKEGDLFPDTYYVAKGTARLDVLRLANDKMSKIKEQFAPELKNAPRPLKNWNQILTLASIVQKETPRVSEMSTVASVYLNRLNINMRLQADPTVVYAITNGYGDMQGQFLYKKYFNIKSAFNTYTNYGLPPSPIANVGIDAINAVLNPATTKYYYFVADGRGGHVFSETYAEHQKNHQKWREIRKSL